MSSQLTQGTNSDSMIHLIDLNDHDILAFDSWVLIMLMSLLCMICRNKIPQDKAGIGFP